jgi:hypothetical protein
VTTVKIWILFVVLFAACAAQTQNQDLKFIKVNPPTDGLTPNSIHFECSRDYDKVECLKDVAALRKALASYPLQLEGDWTYYLVMADDWKPLVRSYGGNPMSPAFSLLLGRATVLDRSLFSGSADRNIELIIWSGIPVGPELVALALSHEMGHAICQDKDERRANDYGKQLREGKVPDCSKTPGHKPVTVAQNPR